MRVLPPPGYSPRAERMRARARRRAGYNPRAERMRAQARLARSGAPRHLRPQPPATLAPPPLSGFAPKVPIRGLR